LLELEQEGQTRYETRLESVECACSFVRKLSFDQLIEFLLWTRAHGVVLSEESWKVVNLQARLDSIDHCWLLRTRGRGVVLSEETWKIVKLGRPRDVVSYVELLNHTY